MTRSPSPRGASLTRGEWLAVVAAVLIAHAFYWRIVLYPSDFDAKNYLEIAQDIARQGLFSKFYYSNVRTYGYPLFLAFLLEIAGANAALWGWLVFEVQLGLLLIAAWALRRTLIVFSPPCARWTFVTLVLNVFVLSYTPESLSESLALTLVLAAAACWLRARAAPGRLWPLVLAGSALVSYSVMVRPANVFALAAWTLAVVLLFVERRPRYMDYASVLLALIIGTAVPASPQVRNNVVNYGEVTPLVVARLATNQQIWGIQYLKYATAMPPVPLPSVFHNNPFAATHPFDAAHPLHWYAQFPGPGVATLALHVFNLTDQDLLFTYSRDLDPWYRIPLGVANHALIALALVGYACLLRQRKAAMAATMIAMLVLAHVTVHAPTAVEMRFGLPLLALAGPLAAFALQRVLASRSRQFLATVIVITAFYVAGALALSNWVRSQSPSITAWRASHS